MDMTRPVTTDVSNLLGKVGQHWRLAALSVLVCLAAAIV
jgi:hypothetical protein